MKQLKNSNVKAAEVSARGVNYQYKTGAGLKEMQLLNAFMEGEEKERSRIARDLHDELSGMIAGAKMHFAALSAKSSNLAEYMEYNQGMDLLEIVAFQVRRISHNLMPEILLENGLKKALERYCRSISNDKLKVKYYSVGQIPRTASDFDLSLYRIAQELINNTVRHSKADEVFVQLSYHPSILSLTIEDNGIGFDIDYQTLGTGLSSVRRRIKAMNGYMELKSEPSKGTSVYLEFNK